MRIVIPFVGVLLLLSACIPAKLPDVKPYTPTSKTPIIDDLAMFSPTTQSVSSFADLLFPTSVRYPDWTTVTTGIAIKEYKITNTDESLRDIIAVVKVNAEKSFHIWQDTVDPKMIDTWQNETNAQVVVNGTYFQETSFLPTGFLFIEGKHWGSLKKPYNGLVAIRETLSLLYSASGQFSLPTNLGYALTSYPMLLHNGEVITTGTSNKESRRTVIATSLTGEIYLCITQRFSFTLDGIARWIASSDFQIQEALNLDGGGSTGLAISSDTIQYTIPNFDAVPNVITIE
jgi:hypothetical protein